MNQSLASVCPRRLQPASSGYTYSKAGHCRHVSSLPLTTGGPDRWDGRMVNVAMSYNGSLA